MRATFRTMVLGLVFAALLGTCYVSVVQADDEGTYRCCFLCPPNPPKDCDKTYVCNPEAGCANPKACCIVNIPD